MRGWIVGAVAVSCGAWAPLGLLTASAALQQRLGIDDPRLVVREARQDPVDAGPTTPGIERIAVHPTRPSWLLATGPARISFVSRDRGRSWAPVLLDAGLGQPPAPPDPAPRWDGSGRLVALRAGALHWSDDGGLSWQRAWLAHGLQRLRLDAWGALWIQADPDRGPAALRVRLEGSDPPQTTALATPPPPPFDPPRPITLDGALHDARITWGPDGTWAVWEGSAAFRPAGLSTWELRSGGLDQPVLVQVQQDARDPRSVALVDAAAQLWLSDDAGLRWHLQPVEDVQQVIALQDGGWLVRHSTLQLSWLQGDAWRALGPTPGERQRLLLPDVQPDARLADGAPGSPRAAAAQAHQAHLRQMVALLLREPSVLRAGVADGGLWLQLDGIDTHRDRWTWSADDGWHSAPSPRATRTVRTAGHRPRCRVAVLHGHAFLDDQPLPSVTDHLGPATLAGWTPQDQPYVVGQRGVWVGSVDEDCVPQPPHALWSWSTGLTSDADTDHLLHTAVVIPEGERLILLGTHEAGLWRSVIPPLPRRSGRHLLHRLVHLRIAWWAAGLLVGAWGVGLGLVALRATRATPG